MKRRVEIHIDRLVLHGLPAGQKRVLTAALERELTEGDRAGAGVAGASSAIADAVAAAVQQRRGK